MAGVLYHPHFEPSLAWLRTSLLVYNGKALHNVS
jgi:hypothetical protein